MSYETRYAAAMRQRAMRDTAEDIEARRQWRAALDKVKAEVASKFPEGPDPRDPKPALDYQQERIEYWRNRLLAGGAV